MHQNIKNQSSILICGSFAFDTIMNFDGCFAKQILPAQLHVLNVSFLVNKLHRDFGGCAGNIAYGLQQLGGKPVPFAAVGQDGERYLTHFAKLGIDCSYIQKLPNSYTAQAMIMTDSNNNQISAFHPGAMSDAGRDFKRSLPNNISLAIIAPDDLNAMHEHKNRFSQLAIPWVFDPGQALPLFDSQDLRNFIASASWVTVNDYEAQVLSERTGWSFKDISQRVRGLIITLGELGCDIWQGGNKERVAAQRIDNAVDPTGCGDAWRAALLFGLERGLSLTQCARLGNAIAACKLTSAGTQNYQLHHLDLSSYHG